MPSTNLIRLGGLAAILSGASLIVAELLYLVVGVGTTITAEMVSSPLYIFQSLLFLLGGVLLIGGLVAFYASQSENLGTLGLAGFLIAVVGTALAVGSFYGLIFVVPAVAQAAPELLNAGPPTVVIIGEVASFGLLAVGWLLLGLAVLLRRPPGYPRPLAVLLMVGAVLAFFPVSFSTVPFGAAVAWLGLRLLSGRAEPARQAPRVN